MISAIFLKIILLLILK